MNIKLKQSYSSIYGVPIISKVDSYIFKIKSCANCFKSNCGDWCCSWGVYLDLPNVERIKKALKENILNFPQKQWFNKSTFRDEDYVNGKCTTTKIKIKNKKRGCIFLDRNNHGCLIHKFCLTKKMDYHKLKPIFCCLFPVVTSKKTLIPEKKVMDKPVVCFGKGKTLYRNARRELQYYFGKKFISELDRLERKFS